MTWLGDKIKKADGEKPPTPTERENRERFWDASWLLVAFMAVLALVVSCSAFGCVSQETVDQIREGVQRIDVNTDALAQTIADPSIQAGRKEALSKVAPVGEAFPWSEVFGGLMATLLAILTGVQVKKYGWQKETAKRGERQ